MKQADAMDYGPNRFKGLLLPHPGLLLCMLLAWQPAQALSEAVDQGEEWQFRALLDDRDIGFHRFNLDRSGTRETIRTEARFAVKLLFVTAYEYKHQNTEVWQDGCLHSISANTNDNGDRYALQGMENKDGFQLTLNEQSGDFDAGCISSFAYWDPRIIDETQLLNAQTGEIKSVSFTFEGLDTVEYQGNLIPSNRYRLNMDDGGITLWYERDNGRWLGLETQTGSGRMLRYVPESLPRVPIPDRAPTPLTSTALP
jgi:hypothetical protein